MPVHRIGVACLLLAATITLQCAARDSEFFEDFSSGWDSRWIQSSDEKYNGKFKVESPKNLDDQALKVCVDKYISLAFSFDFACQASMNEQDHDHRRCL